MLGPPIEPIPDMPVLVSRQISKEEPTQSSVYNSSHSLLDVLMIGTGEYSTGWANNQPSSSDKKAGVVALTMFDLRRRCKIKRIGLCGVNGLKFPSIREHLKRCIGDVYEGLDLALETFPNDLTANSLAYIDALDSFKAGDIAIIFTPDDTHFEIAMEAIKRRIHVLITKPAVKTLDQHKLLNEAAMAHNVLVAIEVHKRWDPMYVDARDQAKQLGMFSYLYSYMSQPKHQLETFKSWAGKSSDISYYLNSHHIDFHEWVVGNTSRPVRVTAMASTGVAKVLCDVDECEDTITLTVQWENIDIIEKLDVFGICESTQVNRMSVGTAIYTSSWIAPKSDVHSQQRFFYMGQKGEINVDQAHRGYTMADDGTGFRNVNPLFMKYTPTDGKFSGQQGYGYRSFEAFVDAVKSINNGLSIPSDYKDSLAIISHTYRTTAILEAGRISLDNHGLGVDILYEDNVHPCCPTKLEQYGSKVIN